MLDCLFWISASPCFRGGLNISPSHSWLTLSYLWQFHAGKIQKTNDTQFFTCRQSQENVLMHLSQYLNVRLIRQQGLLLDCLLGQPCASRQSPLYLYLSMYWSLCECSHTNMVGHRPASILHRIFNSRSFLHLLCKYKWATYIISAAAIRQFSGDGDSHRTKHLRLEDQPLCNSRHDDDVGVFSRCSPRCSPLSI